MKGGIVRFAENVVTRLLALVVAIALAVILAQATGVVGLLNGQAPPAGACSTSGSTDLRKAAQALHCAAGALSR